MARALCECGCGGTPAPGKRFVRHHYSRSQRGQTTRSNTTTCERCGCVAHVKQDGTLGQHFVSRGKAGERVRCPGGGTPQPARPALPGRRVTVLVDVVLPAGWDIPRFRGAASQVLRAHLDEPFIVSVNVEDDGAAS